MKRRELRQHIERLATELGFRWVDKTKRFFGIHLGILIEVCEWDGDVSFKFSSPAAHIGDQLLEDFSGFTHLAAAGTMGAVTTSVAILPMRSPLDIPP